MIEKLKRTIFNIAEENIKGYILVVVVFLAGVALAFMLNISAGSEEEIKLYIEDFISNAKNFSIDSLETFGIAMKGYFLFVGLLFIMSITIIGSISILGYIFIKGFSYGAFFVAVSNMMGTKSIIFFVSTILPHAIITAPCFASYALLCIKNAHGILKGIKDLKSNILSPLLYGVLCMMLCGVAALIQAYFEPLLMRAIKF